MSRAPLHMATTRASPSGCTLDAGLAASLPSSPSPAALSLPRSISQSPLARTSPPLSLLPETSAHASTIDELHSTARVPLEPGQAAIRPSAAAMARAPASHAPYIIREYLRVALLRLRVNPDPRLLNYLQNVYPNANDLVDMLDRTEILCSVAAVAPLCDPRSLALPHGVHSHKPPWLSDRAVASAAAAGRPNYAAGRLLQTPDMMAARARIREILPANVALSRYFSEAERDGISRALSSALRHEINPVLRIDRRGYARISNILRFWGRADISEQDIVLLAAENSKARFEVTSDFRMRACQGQSKLFCETWMIEESGHAPLSDMPDYDIPDLIFHSGYQDDVNAIQNEGLAPMERMHVHFWQTWPGRRRADDVPGRDPRRPTWMCNPRLLIQAGYSVSKSVNGYFLVGPGVHGGNWRIAPKFCSLWYASTNSARCGPAPYWRRESHTC